MRLVFSQNDDGPHAIHQEELHLWAVKLDCHCDPGLLTPSERDRADRFKMERIRLQYVACRVRLRHILGRYLGIDPTLVPITYEANGKPILDPSVGTNLHFNVSHSGDLAIFAVTRVGRVGVDVEQFRVLPNVEALVERFFAARDRDLFHRLEQRDRLTAFFSAWTRKEAVLKAAGQGVPSLDRCEVTFAPGEPEAVLTMFDDTDASKKWLLRSWRPNEEYFAAVAVDLRGG